MKFLKSLFTEHIATKFMALLLAVVLYAVVQQGLQGTQTIAVVELEFTLAAELRDRYTILSPSVVLRDLDIRGMLTKVELLKAQFESSKTRTIEVTQEFLARYQGQTAIRIDEKFLETHKILPEDIKVPGGFPKDPRLRVEENVDVTFDVALAPGMEENTRVAEGGNYEGTKGGGRSVSIRFNIPNLRVRAPGSAFMTDPPGTLLHARIKSVDAYLRDYEGAPLGPSMKVAGVDFAASGIVEEDFVEHARFWVSGTWVRFDDLLRELRALFEVKVRKREEKLPLEIRFVVVEAEDLSKLDACEVEGPDGPVDFSTQDFVKRKCAGFYVRCSATLDRAKGDLAPLILVLDLTRSETAGDIIKVPCYLDVKDPNRGDLLRQVDIQRKPGYEGTGFYILFKPKR